MFHYAQIFHFFTIIIQLIYGEPNGKYSEFSCISIRSKIFHSYKLGKFYYFFGYRQNLNLNRLKKKLYL